MHNQNIKDIKIEILINQYCDDIEFLLDGSKDTFDATLETL